MWICALAAESDTGCRIIDEFVSVFIVPFNISVHLITLDDYIFQDSKFLKADILKTFEKMCINKDYFKGNIRTISPGQIRFDFQILAYLVTIQLLYGTGCLSYWFC